MLKEVRKIKDGAIGIYNLAVEGLESIGLDKEQAIRIATEKVNEEFAEREDTLKNAIEAVTFIVHEEVEDEIVEEIVEEQTEEYQG